MYCDFAGCNCTVCDQIEGACEYCELRDPGRYLQENVYYPELLMDEIRDLIEESRLSDEKQ